MPSNHWENQDHIRSEKNTKKKQKEHGDDSARTGNNDQAQATHPLPSDVQQKNFNTAHPSPSPLHPLSPEKMIITVRLAHTSLFSPQLHPENKKYLRNAADNDITQQHRLKLLKATTLQNPLSSVPLWQCLPAGRGRLCWRGRRSIFTGAQVNGFEYQIYRMRHLQNGEAIRR